VIPETKRFDLLRDLVGEPLEVIATNCEIMRRQFREFRSSDYAAIQKYLGATERRAACAPSERTS